MMTSAARGPLAASAQRALPLQSPRCAALQVPCRSAAPAARIRSQRSSKACVAPQQQQRIRRSAVAVVRATAASLPPAEPSDARAALPAAPSPVAALPAGHANGDCAAPDPYGPLMDELAAFLKEDLTHLFDDRGIDASRYDAQAFVDPITRYNDIQGYLFNIAMLRRVFNPAFTLHSVRRSGPLELTTRWTMEMQLDVWPLRALWAPRLSFTGVSIMGVNPATGKFNRHEDRWDSLNDNTYFSLEGVADLLRQVTRTDSAPALESPRFRLLRRTASYEIREYDDFLDMGGAGGGPAGSVGFNQLAGYIFGGNVAGASMEMTTPVLTSTSGSATTMAFPMEAKLGRDPAQLPPPRDPAVRIEKQPPRVVAVATFGGIAISSQTVDEERRLRAALVRDGLRPAEGYTLARYNDPSTPGFRRRNEVMIELPGYELPQ